LQGKNQNERTGQFAGIKSVVRSARCGRGEAGPERDKMSTR
jgi:hypothetical protein